MKLSGIKVMVKPLSMNEARKGRQYKTDKCNDFEERFGSLLLLAPKPDIPEEGDLEIHFEWGMSNFKRSDYDNPIKVAQDVICKWLNIDDNRFIGGSQIKVRVKKGCEYIKFRIKEHNPEKWGKRIGLNGTNEST